MELKTLTWTLFVEIGASRNSRKKTKKSDWVWIFGGWGLCGID